MSPLVRQPTLDQGELAARQERFPAGAAIEFADLESHARIAALERLRSAEPVSWAPALGGWLVTSYQRAREILSRKSDFTVCADANLVRASLGVMMLTSDPPEHDALRQPFHEPFRMRAVGERYERPVSERIDALLSGLAVQGERELLTDFAAPFAIGVAGDILGLSLDDVPKIQGFYEAFAGAMTYDGDPQPQRRADAARAKLDEILLDELARARARSNRSITAAVANDPACRLTDDEIVAQLRGASARTARHPRTRRGAARPRARIRAGAERSFVQATCGAVAPVASGIGMALRERVKSRAATRIILR